MAEGKKIVRVFRSRLLRYQYDILLFQNMKLFLQLHASSVALISEIRSSVSTRTRKYCFIPQVTELLNHETYPLLVRDQAHMDFFLPDKFLYNCTETGLRCISIAISCRCIGEQMLVLSISVLRLSPVSVPQHYWCCANTLKAALVPDTTESHRHLNQPRQRAILHRQGSK